jgi:hypothetical protein
MTYSGSVLTVDTGYSFLRGGGSFSISGLPSTLYYSTRNSYDSTDVYTFSISLSASTAYNLTFSFYKGLINNYQFDAGYLIGMTGSPATPTSATLTLNNGGVPVNLGYAGPSAQSYETYRTINYTFRT